MIKTTLFTWDEIKKLISAFQEKYKISNCGDIPYHPKGLDIYLTGSTAEPVEEKKAPFEPFKETFDKE